MEFYLHIDGEQKGPYEVTELLEHGMKADTPVWRNGMADWAEARTVTDIAWMVKPIEAPKPPVYNTESAPPAYIPQQEPAQQQSTTCVAETPRCRSGLALAIICLCSPIIYLAFAYFVFRVMFPFCGYSVGQICFVLLLLSTIIITILGIISLVFAITSRVAYDRKQYDVSLSRGNVARTLGWIGVGIMILVAFVVILLGATNNRSYYLY